MSKEKYLVRVIRPVFQAAYLEIEASSEQEAACVAFSSGHSIPEEEWKGRYDPEDYLYDVHCVSTTETTDGNAVSLLDFPKYAILSTNEAPHIGNPSIQPWMNDINPATTAAIISRWIDNLRDERVLYYEEAIEFLQEKLKQWKGSNEKVVPLQPPEERRFNIAITEAAIEMVDLLKEID